MSEAQEARICELLEKGLQHYGMGEPARALAIWSEVLALDPANVRAAEYIKFVSDGLQDGAAAEVAPAAAPEPSPDAAAAATTAPEPARAEPLPTPERAADAAMPPAAPAVLPGDDPLAISWGDLVAPTSLTEPPADGDTAVELRDEVGVGAVAGTPVAPPAATVAPEAEPAVQAAVAVATDGVPEPLAAIASSTPPVAAAVEVLAVVSAIPDPPPPPVVIEVENEPPAPIAVGPESPSIVAPAVGLRTMEPAPGVVDVTPEPAPRDPLATEVANAASAIDRVDAARAAASPEAWLAPTAPALETPELDWGQAFDDLSDRHIRPVAELLTSPPEDPVVVEVPLAPARAFADPAVVAEPTAGRSEPGLHVVAEAAVGAAAPASPWDDGPALSAPLIVDPSRGEFLVPTSGEHNIEVVSQPSGPGVQVAAVVAASGARVDVDECDRLMKGARDMFDLGDFSGSLELVEKVLESDPGNAQARDYLERNQDTLLKMYESKIGSLSRVPRVTIPPDEVIWLNLHHRAGFLLAQIDGLVSFEDLLSLSAMSKLETCKILVQLISEGVIVAS